MTITPLHRRLLLLAPSTGGVPDHFSHPTFEPELHTQALAQAQKLRGRIYVEDGAVQPVELTPDGRLLMPDDEDSWHILTLDTAGNVCGCTRYLAHEPTVSFGRLGVHRSALAKCEQWGQRLRSAIEQDLQVARRRAYAYVEMGGWALREDVRCSTEAIRIALGAYALAKNMGGAISVTTATVRHSSASILRRIGGQPLTLAGTELPSYYDPRYKCEMTILRFDSDQPNPRYSAWIEQIREELLRVPVICRSDQAAADRDRQPLSPSVSDCPELVSA